MKKTKALLKMFEHWEKGIRNKLNFGRPADIPILVPDCGWNHGQKIDTHFNNKKNTEDK